jgi:hypothetical protein
LEPAPESRSRGAHPHLSRSLSTRSVAHFELSFRVLLQHTLNGWPVCSPADSFACTLAGTDARLGADVDRYSFIVADLHHLLLAGFDRRTEFLEFCTYSPFSNATLSSASQFGGELG